ncbi:sulfite exporter TauE/SafE family protein [Schleiferia thermophila]|uniref:sulfite exporter TauE/SafE family protein n=1 Tax=Schleiferia thermophila TaxID=884107 RepID=UPI003EE8D85B
MIVAAFLLGLAGSMHCVGMCGPLALAVPGLFSATTHRWANGLLYHLGRSFTYAAFGALFGLLGKSLSLTGFQYAASLIAGFMMIVMGMLPFLQKRFEKFFSILYFTLNINNLRTKILKSDKNFLYLLILGMLNGLLPCGLVYVALAGALGTGGVGSGALFMFVFGTGTLPAMIFISIGGNTLFTFGKTNFKKALSLVTVLVGFLFLLRAANLNIPFISPSKEALIIKSASVTAPDPSGSCCVKSENSTENKDFKCH